MAFLKPFLHFQIQSVRGRYPNGHVQSVGTDHGTRGRVAVHRPRGRRICAELLCGNPKTDGPAQDGGTT